MYGVIRFHVDIKNDQQKNYGLSPPTTFEKLGYRLTDLFYLSFGRRVEVKSTHDYIVFEDKKESLLYQRIDIIVRIVSGVLFCLFFYFMIPISLIGLCILIQSSSYSKIYQFYLNREWSAEKKINFNNDQKSYAVIKKTYNIINVNLKKKQKDKCYYNGLKNFESKINSSTDIKKVEGSRCVYEVSGSKESLYIKVIDKETKDKYKEVYKSMVKNPPNEELAYLISELFEFHVVPFTFEENDVVIQQGIKYFNLGKYTKNQLHEVILFNIITGRQDGKKENSILNQNDKLMEIDNEYIGFEGTDTFVFNELNETEKNEKIDKELINRIMSIKSDKLAYLIRSYNKRKKIDLSVNSSCITNLERLQQFIKEKDEKVTSSDLKIQFYKRENFFE